MATSGDVQVAGTAKFLLAVENLINESRYSKIRSLTARRLRMIGMFDYCCKLNSKFEVS